MKCPYCSHEKSRVLDKRNALEVIRRRRLCLSCNKRFTTYEKIKGINIVIVKKDGRRESFDRLKLLRGIQKACEKRPVSTEKVNKIVDEIEARLRLKPKNEVKSSYIGELVIKKLKSLDKVAYIRFASVYRKFEDVNDFEKEVKLLKR